MAKIIHKDLQKYVADEITRSERKLKHLEEDRFALLNQLTGDRKLQKNLPELEQKAKDLVAESQALANNIKSLKQDLLADTLTSYEESFRSELAKGGTGYEGTESFKLHQIESLQKGFEAKFDKLYANYFIQQAQQIKEGIGPEHQNNAAIHHMRLMAQDYKGENPAITTILNKAIEPGSVNKYDGREMIDDLRKLRNGESIINPRYNKDYPLNSPSPTINPSDTFNAFIAPVREICNNPNEVELIVDSQWLKKDKKKVTTEEAAAAFDATGKLKDGYSFDPRMYSQLHGLATDPNMPDRDKILVASIMASGLTKANKLALQRIDDTVDPTIKEKLMLEHSRIAWDAVAQLNQQRSSPAIQNLTEFSTLVQKAQAIVQVALPMQQNTVPDAAISKQADMKKDMKRGREEEKEEKAGTSYYSKLKKGLGW